MKHINNILSFIVLALSMYAIHTILVKESIYLSIGYLSAGAMLLTYSAYTSYKDKKRRDLLQEQANSMLKDKYLS